MKKLSEITESIWSDMQERGTGDTIKKEDQIITNIKDMKPVDLGSDVPVYFADIDLEVEYIENPPSETSEVDLDWWKAQRKRILSRLGK